MKKLLLIIGLVAVVLGVAAPPAWRGLSRWRVRGTARARVERMLRSVAEGDEQQAVSAWAEGKIVMQGDDLKVSQPLFEEFWRRSGLVTRSGWKVIELRSVLSSDAVVVELNAGGEKLWLVVTPGEPIAVDQGS